MRKLRRHYRHEGTGRLALGVEALLIKNDSAAPHVPTIVGGDRFPSVTEETNGDKLLYVRGGWMIGFVTPRVACSLCKPPSTMIPGLN